METSPNEIVPEPSACGGIVLGTIARGPVSCANVLTAQYFVVGLRRAAVLVVVAEFARAGWLLDLSPWVTRAELATHFPSTIEPATWNGRVWAMPWLMNVGVLYYRTDLLAKYRLPPPRTWEALVDQVVRVRGAERDPKLDGVVWQGRQYEGLTVNALEAIWANGARVFGADGAVFPVEERAAGGRSVLRALFVSGVC